MRRRSEFELVVVPLGDADLGLELRQIPDGRSEGPRKVVFAAGRNLQAVGDHVLEALREAGHRPSELRRTRTKPFRLPERAGVRLGLALLATKPLRKIRRLEEISAAIRTMSDDEAYYWFAKCTDPEHGLRAQRAFRDLWSDR
jgi:hypothetical protein